MSAPKHQENDSSFDNIHRNSLRAVPSHQYNKNMSSGVSGVTSGALIGHDPEKEFYGPIAEKNSSDLNFAESNYEDFNKQIVRMVSPESGRSCKSSAEKDKLDREELKIGKKYDSDNKDKAAHPMEKQASSNETSNQGLHKVQSDISAIGSGLQVAQSVSKGIISSNYDKLSGNINIQNYLQGNPQVSQSNSSFHFQPASSQLAANQQQLNESRLYSLERSDDQDTLKKQRPSDVVSNIGSVAKSAVTAGHGTKAQRITNASAQPLGFPLSLEDGESPGELQKMAIFQLLRKFKLQQYANRMSHFGFARDIYKLAFLSHREREDLMENLNMLPGHKDKMNDLFRIVEQLNPKNSLRQTLLQALRSSQQKQRHAVESLHVADMERNTGFGSQALSEEQTEPRKTSKSAQKNKMAAARVGQGSEATTVAGSQTLAGSKQSVRHQTSNITKRSTAGYQGSRISNSTQKSNIQAAYGPPNAGGLYMATEKTPISSIDQKMNDTRSARKQLVREQQNQVRQSTSTAARSLSKGKKERDQSNSLNRMYNQLEPRAKLALNQAFLNNIKSGRNHQNFQQAMFQFVNQAKEKRRAKRAIEQIFPAKKFTMNNLMIHKSKPQPTKFKRQGEGSGPRKQKSSAENQRVYSNSRERAAGNVAAQGKPYQRAHKHTPSSILATEPKNSRPPLAGNPASISKSQRKRPLPHFIQTHSQGLALAISPQAAEPAATLKKESSSTRANQLPIMQGSHQRGFSSSKYQNSNPSKANRNASTNHSGDNHGSSFAKRSSTAYYETPDKSSMPLNQKINRLNENAHQHNYRQRMRSSCQSQNKIPSQGSKTSLLPQKQQTVNRTTLDEATAASEETRKNAGKRERHSDVQATEKQNASGNYGPFAKEEQHRKGRFFQQRNTSAKGPRPPIGNINGAGQYYGQPRDLNFRHLLSNRQLSYNRRNREQSKGRQSSKQNLNQSRQSQQHLPHDQSINKSFAASHQNSLDANNTFHTSNLPQLSEKNLDRSVQDPKHKFQQRKNARAKGQSALNSSNLSCNNANSDLSQYIENYQQVKADKAAGKTTRSKPASGVESHRHSESQHAESMLPPSNQHDSLLQNTAAEIRASQNSKDTLAGVQSMNTQMVHEKTIADSSQKDGTEKENNTENAMRLESLKFQGQSPNYSTPTGADQAQNRNPFSNTSANKSEVCASPDPNPNPGQVEPVPEQIQDAINDFGAPLLEKHEQEREFNLGYSFDSKKMAMGPAFFNLRLICDCLGRALRRHIEYSQGVFWFLDQLKEAKQERKDLKKQLAQFKHSQADRQTDVEESGVSEVTAFTYDFKDDLKLSASRRRRAEEEAEPDLERNIDDVDIEANAAEGKAIDSQTQFDNIKKALIDKSKGGERGSSAEEDGALSEKSIGDAELEVERQFQLKEERHVEQIRLDELKKESANAGSAEKGDADEKETSKKKEGELIKNNKASRPVVQKANGKQPEIKNKSYVQLQLIEKDKKIKELTKMVQMYETGKIQGVKSPSVQEVMVIGQENDDEELIKKYDADVYKMSRAEFLMSQIDLDPIESNYSQEQHQVSSNFKYRASNMLSAIGSNNQRRISKNGPSQKNSEARPKTNQDIAEQMPHAETGGQDNNVTMVDGSFNSVSQGVSLNQSSGKYAEQQIVNSGEILNSETADEPNGEAKLKLQPVKMSTMGKSADRKNSMPTKDSRPVKKKKTAQIQKENEDDGFAGGFTREQQLALLQDQLKYFDERMDFDPEIFNDDIDLIEPSADDIAAYSKYVTIASKMENETPIIALVYIERILLKTGILINKYNWKRILLICLCVASKVWDDDSLENVHFPKVMSDVSLSMINKLEEIFLGLFLHYDLVVKGSEYAKYYFIMRTLADGMRDESLTKEERMIQDGGRKRRRRDDWAEYPLIKPISAPQMLQLQRNTAKAEIYLKDRYEKEIIFALAPKFKGDRQIVRQKKFLVDQPADKRQIKYEDADTQRQRQQGKPVAKIEGMLGSTL